jgi:hypothetical protein
VRSGEEGRRDKRTYRHSNDEKKTKKIKPKRKTNRKDTKEGLRNWDDCDWEEFMSD